jgi:bifunctional non-homologous end joining protein LigD
VSHRSAARADTGAASARQRAQVLADLASAGENVALDVGGHALAITHLSRIYWAADTRFGQPAITKRDYLSYLVAVAPFMLPHVRDRPLTLFRWPEGIAHRRVLEKHWLMNLPAFVARVDVFSESKGRADQYVLCNNLATLLWLARMGTLELHMWHSRVRGGEDAGDAALDFGASLDALRGSVLERPDYLLFDLDPFIEADAAAREPKYSARAVAKVKDVAFALHALLDDIGLASLVKTSGRTGLHVIVPIVRALRYDAVREMSAFIGARLLRHHPNEVTTDWSIDRRAGKVFLDANMNVRGKSITVPYSPRGLPGAPVSMPLSWDALRAARASDFRIPTVMPMLEDDGDAWAGWLSRKQDVMHRLAANARP